MAAPGAGKGMDKMVALARCLGLALGLHLGWACAAGSARAQELRTYTKAAAYDDVRFELNEAIIGKGLNIEQTGDIAQMLERTGPDVGSTKPIYKHAGFFSFCSARLSRRMMEADPANIALCPYVVFIYEAVGKPGEVVVGYRRPVAPAGAPEPSREALAAVDALLDGIAREATR